MPHCIIYHLTFASLQLAKVFIFYKLICSCPNLFGLLTKIVGSHLIQAQGGELDYQA